MITKLIQMPDFAAEFLADEIDEMLKHCDLDDETATALGQLMDGLLNFVNIRIAISEHDDEPEPIEFVPDYAA